MEPYNEEYRLQLFIAGMSPGSVKAIENTRGFCDKYLDGKYDLEVIDIYQQRQMIKEMDVIAVPMLIRILPKPEKRIIGNMSDDRKLIEVLEIRT